MQKPSFDHFRKSQEFSGQVISKIFWDMVILKLKVEGGGYNSFKSESTKIILKIKDINLEK